MLGSSQSTDGSGRVLPNLPRLDPKRIRFAQSNPLAGIFYVFAIPASALVVWFLVALIVQFLDSPKNYAPNAAVAATGGLLSGTIKVCFFVGIAMMCGFFWRQAKASFQTDSHERFMSDAGLPVLYLRPFGADFKGGFLDQAPATSSFGLAAPRYVRHVFRTSSSSEEGELVQTLEQSGPVLAIGRPGEKIPPLGAARVYVDHSEWQDFVRLLTYYARIVFVRVGETSGFQWELQHLRGDCDPLKILVFFPPTSGRQRNATLSMVEKELRVALKEIAALQWIEGLWAGHATAFLFAFTQEWQPIEIAHSAEQLVPSLKAYISSLPVPPQSLRDGWVAVHQDLVASGEQNVAPRSNVEDIATQPVRRFSPGESISCIEPGCEEQVRQTGDMLGHTFYSCDAGHKFSVRTDGEAFSRS